MSDAIPLAGVIGWPASHSRSPALHGHWLARHRLRGHYVPLEVAPDDLERALRTLPALGFVGANVTLPHKEAAYRLADVRSPTAERLGAANTLVFREGRIEADNTDGFGFMESLREAVPGWVPGRTVVLGAGGAARAVAGALLDAGVDDLVIANRTLERAQAVADALGGRAVPLSDGALAGASLVINTTSMGMTGGPPLSLTLDALGPEAIAADIVYAPLETPFLKAAAARGARTVDGLGMLLHQARPGFAAWFGVEPRVDAALREAVLRG